MPGVQKTWKLNGLEVKNKVDTLLEGAQEEDNVLDGMRCARRVFLMLDSSIQTLTRPFTGAHFQ